MPSITGKYQHYKNENIDEYFLAVGVPYIGRKMMSFSSPLMEITLDGDKMTIKNVSLFRTIEHSFKLNEEYEEHMPNTKIKGTYKYSQTTTEYERNFPTVNFLSIKFIPTSRPD
ncbi:fatty acid-binding protein, adipocyte-like isoform X2 [Galleria mellonella]|uniref:Fatty acid-binding protein, adipocyte-like isoform X2 n=1 Tax=Galleria mellonella TaxID=7137 RepID=A0ABM3N1U9_GALME|nr:fatty acid-binding protein, adipocyte-like isoform X2 [Galleria mellonella]